jgi:hypothetical protein
VPGNGYPVGQPSSAGHLKVATAARLRTVDEVEEIPVAAKARHQTMGGA